MYSDETFYCLKLNCTLWEGELPPPAFASCQEVILQVQCLFLERSPLQLSCFGWCSGGGLFSQADGLQSVPTVLWLNVRYSFFLVRFCSRWGVGLSFRSHLFLSRITPTTPPTFLYKIDFSLIISLEWEPVLFLHCFLTQTDISVHF